MSISSKGRPRLEIERTSQDRAIDICNAILVCVMIALPAYYYGQLPEKIPVHFNGAGEVDRMGSKISIWLIPAIGFGVYLLLTYLQRIPHTFNYPTKVTEENAAQLYRDSVSLMRWMNFLILVLFVYITWMSIQIALGNAHSMNKLIFWTLTGLTVLLPFYFLLRATKSN